MRTSQEPRKISPRETPASSVSSTGSGRITRLPTELLSEQAQRLVVFSTVALVLWSFALLLDSVVLPLVWQAWERNWRAVVLELCGAIGSAVMCWHLRQSDTTLEEKSNAGITMMLMHAAGIAAFNAWAFPPVSGDVMRLSFIAILVGSPGTELEFAL